MALLFQATEILPSTRRVSFEASASGAHTFVEVENVNNPNLTIFIVFINIWVAYEHDADDPDARLNVTQFSRTKKCSHRQVKSQQQHLCCVMTAETSWTLLGFKYLHFS